MERSRNRRDVPKKAVFTVVLQGLQTVVLKGYLK